jgi:hypothetical protein
LKSCPSEDNEEVLTQNVEQNKSSKPIAMKYKIVRDEVEALRQCRKDLL